MQTHAVEGKAGEYPGHLWVSIHALECTCVSMMHPLWSRAWAGMLCAGQQREPRWGWWDALLDHRR